jgi:hypothetical protein
MEKCLHKKLFSTALLKVSQVSQVPIKFFFEVEGGGKIKVVYECPGGLWL